MEISGNSAYYAGLNAVQAGQNRVDQAAGQIASTAVERSAGSQSSELQVNRLRGVDRSQESDVASSVVQMSVGKLQVELGVKVAKASDEALGTLIDTYA
ncbi:MAG: pyrroloquinoline quinone biosynthesis protein PqqE [Pseudomonas sp.]|uniref:pyrroloquinoline quinone biosynthesis protein PqqE n=1 Tax=Pseudomonas sp. TaxID=306 RepID=UPI003D114705